MKPALREQEQKSLAFWQAQTGGLMPGLLSADDQLSRYRHAAEVKVLFKRLQGCQLLAGQEPLGSVLEVGCGGGRWTPELARRARQVLACDIAPNLVEVARQRIEREQIANVTFQVGSFETLDYARAALFDLVYLGSCLHYMSEEAIDEALTRLAPKTHERTLLLSRDTVSLIGRTFHRRERYSGDDPAIYRPERVYRELMGRHGYALEQSWPTYARPLAWHTGRWLPKALLERLMFAELPLAGFAVRAADALPKRSDKEHRFFLYRREPGALASAKVAR